MAKRKNRAATEQELGLITDIQPDARMNDHHDQHSNANKAIVDLYQALDIDVDGTGDLVLGADFGNNVPDVAGQAGKVLATDGTDYGWAYVDSDHILLTANMNPFGILDDPAAGDPNLTQAGANALFVKYINENEEAVKELALALGLELEVDVDGNITIEIPGGGEVPSLDDKFDAKDAAGDAPANLTNAKDMEDAIESNKADIDNVVVNLGGSVDVDGNITIDNIDALPDQTGQDGKFLTTDGTDASWVDADVFPKGTSSYADAQDVEDAIVAITGLEVLAFQGNVSDAVSLPGGAEEGDVYLVEDVSEFHVMTSDGWKFLGKLGISAAELAQLQSDIAGKYEAGVGPLDYADATVLGQAVKANEGSISENATNINNLAAELNLVINPDGSIEIIGGGQVPDLSDLEQGIADNATAIAGKFDIGTGTQNLNDATAMEAAIDANTENVTKLITGLGGDVENIEVDGLPDQSGASGKFLTTDGSDASWGDVTVAPDDTKFDKGSVTYADAGAMETDIKQNASDIADNAADISTNATAIADKFNKGATTYVDAKEMQDAIEANADAITTINSSGYDDQWIQPAIDEKFDTNDANGDAPTTFTNAKDMEDAIDANATNISNLSGEFDKLAEDLAQGGQDLTVDLQTYLKKGDGLVAADAKELEDKIKKNTDDIALLENYDDTALEGRVSDNETDISNIKTEQTTQNTNIANNTTAIADKLDKGTSTYADAREIQDAIESIEKSGYDDTQVKADIATNASDIADNATEIAKKFDKGTSTYADARAAQDAIEAIVVPDVSDFVTGDDLTTALSGKADEPHTHDEYLTDLTHDHDGTYQPVGDYATKTELSDGLAGKSDDGHTHDTTHDHDSEYQPKGDYATSTDLGTLEGRVSDNESDIAALQAIDPYDDTALAARVKTNEDDIADIKTEQITQNTDIKANADKNTEQDGKISALETANQSLENKVDSLENAIVSAQYAITLSPGARGQVFVNDGNPMNVTTLDFSDPDANGVNHDFGNVKAGDLLTLATSSAVGLYEISAVIGKQLSVVAKSGNGTFVEDDLADVFVQPEFDASSYATTEYVDAQDDLMYPKGVVPNGEDRTYKDAYALEQAVLQNAEDLANLDIPEGQNVTVSEDLPTASDGDNGDWWIYQPILNTFAVTDDYEPGDFLGFYTGGIELSASGVPAMATINTNQQPTANGTHTHRANKTCADEVGTFDAERLMSASWWMDLTTSDYLYYETVDKNDWTLVKGTVVYKFDYSFEASSSYNIELTPIAQSGISSWDNNNTQTKIYKAVVASTPPTPDEPEEQGNTLFYKDNDEWLQIGDGSDGGGSNAELEAKVNSLHAEVDDHEVRIKALEDEGFLTLDDIDGLAQQSDLEDLAAEVATKATLMHLTQDEYDALLAAGSVDENTLYVVT